MAKLFDIQETTVVIPNLTLTQTQGSLTHVGNAVITGAADVLGNLKVVGTISADTFNVKNLVTDNGSLNITGNWLYNTELELNGKGFTWAHANAQTQLIYRTGGRLWTNANLDIGSENSYNIDNIPVLTANALGSGITESNLSKVGTLSTLEVSGDVSLGDFVFVNSVYNRLGIGTNEPNAAIDILDNNVNIIIGSPDYNLASIGTHSSHDLAIVTDNLARISIKSSGEVNIGDPTNGGGVLNVFGVINATSVVTDNRIDRTHPLQFLSTKDTSAFGLGLVWKDKNVTHEFRLDQNPERFTSTAGIDLLNDQCYYIDTLPVLSSTKLGNGVLNSSLTTVGILQSLTVSGSVELQNTVTVNHLQFNNGIAITQKTISSASHITVSVAGKESFYGDNNQISIGDKQIQGRPVKVFGPLSVNINNPDPSLQFSVNGDVNIGGRRFTNSTSAPTSGVYAKGDICWNTNPTPNSYIGWVCIVAGTPGQWAGFGMIASQ